MSETLNQNEKEKIKIINERKMHMNSPMIFKRYKMRKMPKVNHLTMVCLANVLSLQSNIDLSRESKRRMETLYYWFEDNLEQLEPFIKMAEIEYENNQIISLSDFQRK